MNPVKTLCFTFSLVALLAVSAVAQTLYFYPPDDPKWIAGRSYISQGNSATAVALDLETSTTKCGWYKASIPSSSPLRNFAQFWLGKPGIDRIGPNGRWSTDFEPTDDFSAVGDVFRLGEIFAHFNNPANLYVVADELDPMDRWAGWYTTDPSSDPTYNDQSRCKWTLAAFIYDTDASVHPDFSCGRYSMGKSEGNGDNTYAMCQYGPAPYTSGGNLKPRCTGVVKGLASSTIDPVTRKIKCGNCTKNGCWTNEDWFNKAFTSTPKVNVRRCYDMPFSQVKSGKAAGSFEFDSDTRISTIGGKLIGGFFPEVLASRGTDDYSQCPTCDAKRDADRFPPLIRAITKDRFDDYDSKEGDFNDGDHPPRSAFGQTGTESIYDWSARDTASWYLHGTSKIVNEYGSNTTYSTPSQANEHFCFESHADFYYDPSQEFYFSGDDDIWIYIDSKLVIDLGGNHMAAPGHVKLKDITPALEEGKLYPIDIFFCDKRTANSNVRITTNMYVVQKSSFENQLGKADNIMCASVTGGADCASKMSGSNNLDNACGPKLTTAGFQVDFYMINRVTKDTIYLSPTRGSTKNPSGAPVERYSGCNGQANFKCNGDNGITVTNAVYTCGGRGQCKGNPEAAAKVGITGSYSVYARLMDSQGKQVVGTKPLLIDNFKGESNDRIVWGTLAGQNSQPGSPSLIMKNAYGRGPSEQRQEVVVGKRVPVYLTTGSWNDGFNSFEYDDDPEIAGHSITLSIIGSGITIYETENSPTPIGKNSIARTLSASGIDTVWVQIDYDVEDKREYSLNVVVEGSTSPSMKIVARQPKLQFVKPSNPPATYTNVGSGWQNWQVGGLPPYAGSPMDLYLQALDPANNNEICITCNTSAGFILRESSETVGACKTKLKNDIVTSLGRNMEKGEAKIIISGQESTGEPECTTKWTVYGLNKDATTATWDKLRFRDPPVPIPRNSMIFDVNNDGIGDSVYIAFSKPFSGDSLLPVLLQVVWGDTTYFFAPFESNDANKLKDPSFVESLYKRGDFRNANKAYWGQYIKANDTLVTIGRSKFSSNIRTVGNNVDKVSSWIPFLDVENKSKFTYTSNESPVDDRIAPIVVKATYNPEWGKGCENGDGSNDNGCREKLIVTLSERVFPRNGVTTFDIKNPFRYCLKSQNPSNCGTMSDEQRFDLGYDNLDWRWEAPQAAYAQDTTYLASYKPGSFGDNNMDNSGGGSGDSTITLTYYHGKTGNSGETTHKPKAGDWVKIRPNSDGAVFVDASGNPANWYGRERGVAITGRNNPTREQVKIAAVNPDNKDPLGGIFKGDGNKLPEWWSDGAKDAAKNLYQAGTVSEVLPVINPDPKEVKKDYPGSVGAIFNMGSTFNSDIPTFLDPSTGRSLPDGMNSIAEAITIHASAYYHTNLGDYTAHRENIVAQCNSPIFNGDCTNNYKFYVAWDLMTSSNPPRFVGAGAYVGISKFHVQLRYKDAGGEHIQKFGQQEFIEMYGVKRAKINNSKPSEPPSEPPPVEGSLFGFKRSK